MKESLLDEYETWLEKANDIIIDVALKHYNFILRDTPVDTGLLISNMEIDFNTDDDLVGVEVTNETEYFDFVEYGTAYRYGVFMVMKNVLNMEQEIEDKMKRI